MVIPQKKVSGNSHIYFQGNPLVSTCVVPLNRDNMGRETHNFRKHQSHCSDPNLYTSIELENVRGVISKYVTEVNDERPYTIKKGYSVISSKQDFDPEVDRVQIRKRNQSLSLLKTPSNINYSENKNKTPLVVPRELTQGPKLDDAGNIALKGQYDQITAQIHELKKRSPVDASERNI